jgi:hypothetical protein
MNTESSQFKPDIARLFREYLGALQSSPRRDDYGFVQDSGELFRFDRLLSYRAILIVGPPWIGKSFVADQINQRATTAGNQYVFSTNLHLHSPGEPVMPLGWNAWVASGKPAIWIIDSLDEGESIQRNIHQVILRELGSLKQGDLQRLQIVFFCREVAVPDALIPELVQHYGDQFIATELLPLTQDDARHIVATREFDRILAKITKHQLHDATQYPAGIKYVERHLDDDLTTTEIWKGVLRELLSEQDPERQKRLAGAPEISEQFRAAAQLACVMSFSGIDSIACTVADLSGRRLDELIPEPPSRHDESLKAARHALGSAMFARGRRFSQKNIREWMCAFALNELALGQLKTLLTDGDGNLNRGHLGILRLLMEIGRQDLRDWLLHVNRGLPLPSDLSSLTLTIAKQILDRLEELAESSPWAIRLWGEDNVKHLRIAGIGAELAARIGDRTRTATRRLVLLQIATTIDAREAVATALAILRNSRLPQDLVETALVLTKKLASPDDFRSMESFVRSAKPSTRIRRAVVSAIIQSFLDQDSWTVEEAVMYAPDARGDVLDSTHLLQKTLSDRLTLEAARIVVQRKLPEVLTDSTHLSRTPAYPQEDILYRAISLILEQESPSACDLNPLIPLALRQWDAETHLRFHFTPTFRKVEASRRQLYLAELEKSRLKGEANPHRSFRWVLMPDDVEWLINQLPDLAGTNDAVWEDVMIAAHGGAESIQERARSFIREHRPAILEAFTKSIAEHDALEQRLAEQRRAAEQASRKREISIAAFVASVLKDSGRPLQQRMWDLSMVCFPSEHARPSDLIGTWDDLDAATQNDVLNVCVAAVRDCQPTSFSADSFTRAVQFEAWCFRAVIKNRLSEITVDAALIANWLPGLLVWTSEADAEVIDVCYQIDLTTTEAVFLAAIRRDMQSGSPHAVAASNLDTEYWTPTLIEHVDGLIRSSDFSGEARASLLKVLAARDEVRGVAIARDLLKSTANSELGDAVLRVLLTSSPDEGWPYVERDYAAGNRRSLFILAQLFDMSTRYRFDTWPADRLCKLATMLFATFPPKRRGESHDGFVTPEYQCRQLRDAIPGILFYRAGKDDRDELAKLVDQQPLLQGWHRRALAEEKAKRLLETQFLPLRVVQDALSNPDYRWVRHNADLMAVIEEQLHAIAKDIGDDAELLYRIGGGSPQLQREGAIQAYVFRRLADRLPARVLGSDATIIDISRERQGRFLQRKDLLVEARCIDGSKASVVIELKWSENRDISTSLARQLGDKYLVAEHRTHGIYLVAWTGKVLGWKTKAQTPTPTSCNELREALEQQATHYAAKHGGIVIHSFVFDITWPAKPLPRRRQKKKTVSATKKRGKSKRA